MPTPNLSLPFLESGQAQKHVTHNEALRLLDAVTQLAVVAVSASPPAEPADGERHLVGTGATGAFAGHDAAVAAFQDGAWNFLTPRMGWRAWNADTEQLLVWTGAAWSEISGGSGEGDVAGPDGGVADGDIAVFDGTTGKAIRKDRGAIAYLGVGTAADATGTDTSNRLVVRGNRALFDAIPVAETPGSGDIKIQLSKEAADNAASWFFSTNYEPRGEIGFIEDDDELRVKVFDGTDWHEGLSVVRATGAVKIGGTALGDAATKNTGSSAGTLAAGNDSRIVGAAQTGSANTFTASQAIESAAADPLTLTTQASQAAANGAIVMRRARNSSGSPSAVLAGDTLAAINARGYGTTGYSSTGRATFTFRASENWTDSAHGTEFALQTTPAGSTSRADRMVVTLGLYHPSATGGDKGNNTINFGAVYDDNSLLTCMALAREFRERGEVDLEKWDATVPDQIEPETREEVPVMVRRRVPQTRAVDERGADGALVRRLVTEITEIEIQDGA